jgi:peptide deformylase
MNILKYPDPNLFRICAEVTVFGPELIVLLESMWEAMREERAIGLASNQVGLTFRMFAMKYNDEKLFVVNPKILRRSQAPANLKEGCLSAPGEFLIISDRAAWVEVRYQDEKGALHTRVFQGIHSVCAQHEVDHLDGKSHLQSKTIAKKARLELAKKWGFKLK